MQEQNLDHALDASLTTHVRHFHKIKRQTAGEEVFKLKGTVPRAQGRVIRNCYK